MTKKHFEQLAYKFAMCEPADVAINTNPRFDRGRFLTACRFDYWTNRKPPKGV